MLIFLGRVSSKCMLPLINSDFSDLGYAMPSDRPALDISTGPLARRTFQTAGSVRASTFYLSLARTDHLDMSGHQISNNAGPNDDKSQCVGFAETPPHISAVFVQSFCYSEMPAWRESESGMSIKHTDVSV